MKKVKFTLIALLVLAFAIAYTQNQGVAINSDGSQADPSAMLDVKSTTGGVLVPRMTETQRNAINGGNAATGLLVYQTDNTPGYYYFDGSSWQMIGGGADTDWTVSGNNMYSNNSGNVGIGTSNPGAKLDVAGHIWQTGTGHSIFLGEGAGENDNLSNNVNVFIGQNAGNLNSSGTNNVAIGAEALLGNTNGYENVAIGGASLWLNGSGHANVSIGMFSSSNNTGGSFNTALGYGTYKAFANSNYNTAIGYNALGDLELIPWGLGYYSGDRLTAVGYESLFNNQDGIRNTGVGYKALYENKSGSNNTAIGNDCGPSATNLSNTGAFGSGAVPTSSNRIHIGNTSISWIGGQVGWSTYSDARFKTNVQENVAGLDFIMLLKPVTYQWDIEQLDEFVGTPSELYEDENMVSALEEQKLKVYAGFLAQEVEQAAQLAGFNFSGVQTPENENSPYSLRYAEFVVPLVKAIQEQQAQIDELMNNNKQLQQEIDQLKANR
jgi:hypothetical protein